ncbi:alanine racemase [Thermodesulfobacterium sp. TA1]|uniref:alanine racemase n=1 Tax=Thermodesulfobacterium sp. TA1 TaxID=2234087 RepID=UPI001F0E417E|nr:alanine racemase [Thermodesulfobacterium sp. TA1]
MSLENLKKNLKALKGLLPEGTKVLPVIKNDAYGHGLIEVAKTLAKEGVWGFGLSEPQEAYFLRKAGFKHPLLLLSGFEKDWLEEMFRLEITPVVTNFKALEWLEELGKKNEKKISFHLKVDTGMHRFGISKEELTKTIDKIKNSSFLHLEGIMTHLACSEKPDSELTQSQLSNFKKALEILHQANLVPSYVHFANSGGIIFSSEKGNLVRPGISLYGGYPDLSAKEKIKLYPVMTLRSRIVELKKLRKGDYAGYGPTFKAERNTLLGIVPVGYGDGYLRSLGNKGFAFFRDRRVQVVGTVSMKALYVDLTEIESPQIGEEIILLGGDNREVPAEELAMLGGTICYELLCGLGRAIPREYR